MPLGAVHGWLSQQPRVNELAMGIAMTILGSGLAFFLGKSFIQLQAPQLQAVLKISPLFLGVAIALLLQWFFRAIHWGIYVRAIGDSPAADRAMGSSIFNVGMSSSMAGSVLAGLGGACLSLYYPSVWTERILFNAIPYILTLLMMIDD
ncbi:abc transporter permease [Leptolyngbya sp. Heron Island J]|uniref:ABC transporter permease subunit n=1 Tax=Leptolyngbya sp. Heron Island J TaxID=1385935 RepID=UPI0003B9AB7D|nr:ABC transporter permease [Leptolyngbya sp. Heron Island J]ESA37235.1 abc transporter permease [Leptolyngbya sp. Heron Island J]